MDGKIVVSNRSSLTAKYGKAGLAKVEAAVAALIAADKGRGIRSRLVYLDDAAAMKKVKGRAVTLATSPRQNKEAIDAVFRATDPEYLMILGAPDVVPHQDLKNLVFKENDDDDRFAYGDLPYACEAAYSQDAAKFKGPTRVVGRLPDLRGAREPSYLLTLVKAASQYRTRDVKDYARYFMSTDEVEPRRVEGISGTVERGPFGAGSKSARDAVWINTPQGRFVLRRKDGPTFDDPALDRYVGKRVTCNGFIVAYSLLADRISVGDKA